MTCFHPLQAFKLSNLKSSSGKSVIVFFLPKFGSYERLFLPCGQCVGCRLERSRQWAVRCVHESRLYSDNCFITLTFSDDSLLKRSNPLSVDVRDFQLFIKRLRKRFGSAIRYFHCGEYGELYARPHYHACLFNFDFPDKLYWKTTNGFKLFTSRILSELWPFGFSSIGSVSFDSAAYVARYIMKKVNGSRAFRHYCDFDSETGEIFSIRKPEYVTMSRRPGLGKFWFDKYSSDVYVHNRDSVVMNGHKFRPPRYYDSQFELLSPLDLEALKLVRIRKATLHASDNTSSRLLVREAVQLASFSKLIRPLE